MLVLKKYGILSISIFILLIYAFTGDVYAQSIEYLRGKVIEITSEDLDLDFGGGMSGDVQYFKVEVQSGELKGQILELENTSFGDEVYDLWFEAGDRVFIEVYETDQGFSGHVVDYQRDIYLSILLVVFLVIIILIGKIKGIKAIVSLGVTIILILKILIPMILRGYSPFYMSLLIAFASTLITYIIIGGFTSKIIGALAGTLVGLFLSASISFIISGLAHIKGISGDEINMLLYLPTEINLDLTGLFLGGVIIGALGAVMDVSISISSSISEIKKNSPMISFKGLFLSGMEVGKDIMGTMTNTLILAYTGASLPLLLIINAYDFSFTRMINMEFIAIEFVRAMAGSIGLIVAIPATALTTAYLMTRKEMKKNV